jgi:glucose-6-phosphate 1-dehydrogenase
VTGAGTAGAPSGSGFPPGGAPPCLLVIFGASGDLAARKLVPALFELHRDRLLPRRFAVLGVSRTPMSDAAFRDKLRTAAAEFGAGPFDAGEWDAFAPSLAYHAADLSDEREYGALAERAAALCGAAGIPGNLLFYAAVAPKFYAPLAEAIGRSGLAAPSPALPGWRRIVVEKPFGEDLESARSLARRLTAVFPEPQLYRIDHYLGKETVQNMLVFRFANGIFEPLWNRNYVDHVQVTVAETIGVEGRGEYYESAGAVRDMVQNHLLQLLALVAMEPPVSLSADDVRDEKRKLLHAVEPVAPGALPGACVRGQYSAGLSGGRPVPGYREERHVRPSSLTETYAAFRFTIDNWRWGGVPFYLRTGKRMSRAYSEIAVRFRPAPTLLFNDTPCGQMEPNWLVINVQPDEGIYLRFGAKVPGPAVCVRPVEFSFNYREAFGARVPSPYSRLLLDAMHGDATLFPRMDSVEAAWSLLDPFLSRWKSDPGADLALYPAGSDGPPGADALFGGRGGWRTP